MIAHILPHDTYVLVTIGTLVFVEEAERVHYFVHDPTGFLNDELSAENTVLF
jgi:hypothetical protein